MKIYLASSFSLIHLVNIISELLEENGHSITTKWWSIDNINIHAEKDDSLHPDRFYSHPACEKIFLRDYQGILECDAFILINDYTPRKFNGANVELGIAIAMKKPVFSTGRFENCALYYPVSKCDNPMELLEKLWLYEMSNLPQRKTN